MSGPEVDSSLSAPGGPAGLRRLLPPIDSPRYHLLLGGVAIFILGPLGGISAAFMNFSIGFFIGGQVLAGILGSTITLGYGPEGKHGANYMQTMAASVAGMCGMAVLIQARYWLGLPDVPACDPGALVLPALRARAPRLRRQRRDRAGPHAARRVSRERERRVLRARRTAAPRTPVTARRRRARLSAGHRTPGGGP